VASGWNVKRQRLASSQCCGVNLLFGGSRTMKKLLAYYIDHVWLQSLLVIVPFFGYVVGFHWWHMETDGLDVISPEMIFRDSPAFRLAMFSFYAIFFALFGILTAAAYHRLKKQPQKSRSSLSVFCILFLLVFFTIGGLMSPMGFRTRNNPAANQGGHNGGTLSTTHYPLSTTH
jgi:amino acid transporter